MLTKVATCKSQTTIPETHFGINTTVNVVQQLHVRLLQTRHVHMLNVLTMNALTKVATCKSQTTIPETHFGINTTVNVVQQLHVWLLQTRHVHVLNVFTLR